MLQIHEKNNFIYLTTALIVLLVAAAVQEELPGGMGHTFLNIIILGTFIVAFMSLNFGTQWRRFVMFLVVAWIATVAGAESTGLFDRTLPSLLILLVFYLGESWFAARRVLLSGKRIDRNIMVGALAMYLLIGLVWSTVFLIILHFSPDAFRGIEAQDYADNFSIAVYFSFVTMTSLGYGDISPAEPISQVVTILAAISGAFYMAVVVATMVGARANSREQDD
ncbi:MAG: two pore domain potassium channel family protein [Halieaceae bacterium]|nr:two pore domain potassium channel family protein [Halieaceae bacterium]